MVFGGTRFARSERRRRSGATPRVFDVEVRPPHKTLYEVLVVPSTTSTRQIRRIARALRRNLPNTSDLHDVCLAEQVLGRPDLRARYDALLARVRAAKQAMPEIGAAIEGSRLGPSFGSRMTSAGRAGTTAAGRVFKLLLQFALVIFLIVLAFAGLGAIGGHRTNRFAP